MKKQFLFVIALLAFTIPTAHAVVAGDALVAVLIKIITTWIPKPF